MLFAHRLAHRLHFLTRQLAVTVGVSFFEPLKLALLRGLQFVKTDLAVAIGIDAFEHVLRHFLPLVAHLLMIPMVTVIALTPGVMLVTVMAFALGMMLVPMRPCSAHPS